MFEFMGLTFDYISIAYAVIFLIYCIIGIKKGFIQGLLKLIKGVVSIGVATLLCKPTANYLVASNVGITLDDKVSTALFNKGGLFASEYTPEALEELLTQMFIPDQLKDYVRTMFSSYGASGESVASVFSKVIVFYGLVVASFLVFCLIVGLILKLFSKLFTAIEDKLKMIKFVNHFLGLFLYGTIGILICCFAAYIMTFIIPFGGTVGDFLVEQMHLADDTMTISKYIYNQNVVVKLLNIINKYVSK